MDPKKSNMDLKKYLVVNHPQILKKYQESKINPQPPKSAPANLPDSQFFATPLNSPILPTHEFFPEIVYPSPSTPPTLSEASTKMSSPTKVIPETELQSPSQSLFQSPSQSPTIEQRGRGLSQEDLIQLNNRIESYQESSSPTFSQSPSLSPVMEQQGRGLTEEDLDKLFDS